MTKECAVFFTEGVGRLVTRLQGGGVGQDHVCAIFADSAL